MGVQIAGRMAEFSRRATVWLRERQETSSVAQHGRACGEGRGHGGHESLRPELS